MWYLYPIALLAGIATAVEPGQNATLGKSLGNPLLAGLVCFSGSVLIFAAIMVATGRLSLPSGEQVAATPWWAWLSGALGAVVILSQLYVSARIGAATFLGLVVTAGVLTSILLDHFGLVGFEVHRASLWRVLGGVLMVAGVALVALF